MILLGWKAAICGTAFSSEHTALRVLVALGRGHVRGVAGAGCRCATTLLEVGGCWLLLLGAVVCVDELGRVGVLCS